MSDYIREMMEATQRIGRTEVKEVPLTGIGARVYNSANIVIANATTTALTFDSERYDPDDMHSTSVNTGRLTCTRAGKHIIIGTVQWAQAAGGRRQIAIRLNGATTIGVLEIGSVADATAFPIQTITTIYDLAVGDYAELLVFQSSGGNLNVSLANNYSPDFMIQRLP